VCRFSRHSAFIIYNIRPCINNIILYEHTTVGATKDAGSDDVCVRAYTGRAGGCRTGEERRSNDIRVNTRVMCVCVCVCVKTQTGRTSLGKKDYTVESNKSNDIRARGRSGRELVVTRSTRSLSLTRSFLSASHCLTTVCVCVKGIDAGRVQLSLYVRSV